jgi:hypothetical protein
VNNNILDSSYFIITDSPPEIYFIPHIPENQLERISTENLQQHPKAPFFSNLGTLNIPPSRIPVLICYTSLMNSYGNEESTNSAVINFNREETVQINSSSTLPKISQPSSQQNPITSTDSNSGGWLSWVFGGGGGDDEEDEESEDDGLPFTKGPLRNESSQTRMMLLDPNDPQTAQILAADDKKRQLRKLSQQKQKLKEIQRQKAVLVLQKGFGNSENKTQFVGSNQYSKNDDKSMRFDAFMDSPSEDENDINVNRIGSQNDDNIPPVDTNDDISHLNRDQISLPSPPAENTGDPKTPTPMFPNDSPTLVGDGTNQAVVGKSLETTQTLPLGQIDDSTSPSADQNDLRAIQPELDDKTCSKLSTIDLLPSQLTQLINANSFDNENPIKNESPSSTGSSSVTYSASKPSYERPLYASMIIPNSLSLPLELENEHDDKVLKTVIIRTSKDSAIIDEYKHNSISISSRSMSKHGDSVGIVHVLHDNGDFDDHDDNDDDNDDDDDDIEQIEIVAPNQEIIVDGVKHQGFLQGASINPIFDDSPTNLATQFTNTNTNTSSQIPGQTDQNGQDIANDTPITPFIVSQANSGQTDSYIPILTPETLLSTSRSTSLDPPLETNQSYPPGSPSVLPIRSTSTHIKSLLKNDPIILPQAFPQSQNHSPSSSPPASPQSVPLSHLSSVPTNSSQPYNYSNQLGHHSSTQHFNRQEDIIITHPLRQYSPLVYPKDCIQPKYLEKLPKPQRLLFRHLLISYHVEDSNKFFSSLSLHIDLLMLCMKEIQARYDKFIMFTLFSEQVVGRSVNSVTAIVKLIISDNQFLNDKCKGFYNDHITTVTTLDQTLKHPSITSHKYTPSQSPLNSQPRPTHSSPQPYSYDHFSVDKSLGYPQPLQPSTLIQMAHGAAQSSQTLTNFFSTFRDQHLASALDELVLLRHRLTSESELFRQRAQFWVKILLGLYPIFFTPWRQYYRSYCNANIGLTNELSRATMASHQKDNGNLFPKDISVENFAFVDGYISKQNSKNGPHIEQLHQNTAKALHNSNNSLSPSQLAQYINNTLNFGLFHSIYLKQPHVMSTLAQISEYLNVQRRELYELMKLTSSTIRRHMVKSSEALANIFNSFIKNINRGLQGVVYDMNVSIRAPVYPGYFNNPTLLQFSHGLHGGDYIGQKTTNEIPLFESPPPLSKAPSHVSHASHASHISTKSTVQNHRAPFPNNAASFDTKSNQQQPYLSHRMSETANNSSQLSNNGQNSPPIIIPNRAGIDQQQFLNPFPNITNNQQALLSMISDHLPEQPPPSVSLSIKSYTPSESSFSRAISINPQQTILINNLPKSMFGYMGKYLFTLLNNMSIAPNQTNERPTGGIGPMGSSQHKAAPYNVNLVQEGHYPQPTSARLVMDVIDAVKTLIENLHLEEEGNGVGGSEGNDGDEQIHAESSGEQRNNGGEKGSEDVSNDYNNSDNSNTNKIDNNKIETNVYLPKVPIPSITAASRSVNHTNIGKGIPKRSQTISVTGRSTPTNQPNQPISTQINNFNPNLIPDNTISPLLVSTTPRPYNSLRNSVSSSNLANLSPLPQSQHNTDNQHDYSNDSQRSNPNDNGIGISTITPTQHTHPRFPHPSTQLSKSNLSYHESAHLNSQLPHQSNVIHNSIPHREGNQTRYDHRSSTQQSSMNEQAEYLSQMTQMTQMTQISQTTGFKQASHPHQAHNKPKYNPFYTLVDPFTINLLPPIPPNSISSLMSLGIKAIAPLFYYSQWKWLPVTAVVSTTGQILLFERKQLHLYFFIDRFGVISTVPELPLGDVDQNPPNKSGMDSTSAHVHYLPPQTPTMSYSIALESSVRPSISSVNTPQTTGLNNTNNNNTHNNINNNNISQIDRPSNQTDDLLNIPSELQRQIKYQSKVISLLTKLGNQLSDPTKSYTAQSLLHTIGQTASQSFKAKSGLLLNPQNTDVPTLFDPIIPNSIQNGISLAKSQQIPQYINSMTLIELQSSQLHITANTMAGTVDVSDINSHNSNDSNFTPPQTPQQAQSPSQSTQSTSFYPNNNSSRQHQGSVKQKLGSGVHTLTKSVFSQDELIAMELESLSPYMLSIDPHQERNLGTFLLKLSFNKPTTFHYLTTSTITPTLLIQMDADFQDQFDNIGINSPEVSFDDFKNIQDQAVLTSPENITNTAVLPTHREPLGSVDNQSIRSTPSGTARTMPSSTVSVSQFSNNTTNGTEMLFKLLGLLHESLV